MCGRLQGWSVGMLLAQGHWEQRWVPPPADAYCVRAFSHELLYFLYFLLLFNSVDCGLCCLGLVRQGDVLLSSWPSNRSTPASAPGCHARQEWDDICHCVHRTYAGWSSMNITSTLTEFDQELSVAVERWGTESGPTCSKLLRKT